MATPRVFVSSTYYDLKYVRERLERFIKSYNMEPVLFEYDKVYFNPNSTPTSSCYKEIEGCHLVLLIIGGRYGSIDKENEKDLYDKEYVSVTQNEYRTAVEKGVPTMVFVDRNVYADYKTFQKNKNVDIPAKFQFAHVDDIKVFEFISKVELNTIKTFDNVEDVEKYFANQISGMLYEYLVGLQNNKESKKIKTAVEEIKTVSNSMQNMINSIAEKVLGAQDKKYQEALFEQKKSLVDFFLEGLGQNVNWGTWDFDVPKEKIEELKTIFVSTILNRERISAIMQIPDLQARYLSFDELNNECVNRLNGAYEGANVVIHFERFKNQLLQIMDKTEDDEKLKKYLLDKLTKTIIDMIQPF